MEDRCDSTVVDAFRRQCLVDGWTRILTLASVRALPDELPEFFRKGDRFITHMVYDPDVAKNRATPLARGTEYSEHFADLEYLKGAELPRSRYDFIQLCHEVGVKPEKVGFVPYTIAEWTERLAVAFAEHRRWPDDPYIQAKCQVYAGILSHYAQDACQPLHLTIHFNGWVNEDGSVDQKGIHARIDMLPEYFEMDPDQLAEGQEVVATDSLMAFVVAQIDEGFQLVETVYELGPRIPEIGQKDWKRDPEVVGFALSRARAAVSFTASLYLTAWRKSEYIQLGDWLDLRVEALK